MCNAVRKCTLCIHRVEGQLSAAVIRAIVLLSKSPAAPSGIWPCRPRVLTNTLLQHQMFLHTSPIDTQTSRLQLCTNTFSLMTIQPFISATLLFRLRTVGAQYLSCFIKTQNTFIPQLPLNWGFSCHGNGKIIFYYIYVSTVQKQRFPLSIDGEKNKIIVWSSND